MKIAVLSRVTPDLVEELEIDEAGKLRKDYLRFMKMFKNRLHQRLRRRKDTQS